MLKDFMSRDLVTAEPSAKVTDVARLMESENVGCVLVLDNMKPRGLITDRDIVLRCIAKNVDVDDCTVENVMTEALHTVRETDGIFDCIQKMHDVGVRRIPVIDEDGRAVGIVSFGDLVAILSKELYQVSSKTTAESVFETKMAA